MATKRFQAPKISETERILSFTSTNSSLTNENESTRFFDIERLIKKYYNLKNRYVREFLSELFGTAILVLFGCASIAQFNLSKENIALSPNLLTINLTFGFALTLSILITCKSSGGHLNPAVSFATLLVGKMTFLRFLVYLSGQFMGGFLGAVIVYITYLDALKALPNMFSLENAAIFSTYPHENLSIVGGIVDQVVGTFLLITVYLAMVDKRNNSKEDGIHWTTVAFVMGLAVCVIGMSFGYNSAYAINPARDFSPRLFSLIAGWGGQTFTSGNYFFWIPLVVPMLASFLATIFYILFINNLN